MSTDFILGVMFGVFCANGLTIFFLRGMWEYSQREKAAKAEGAEPSVPPYVYILILGPLAIMVAIAYYLKSLT